MLFDALPTQHYSRPDARDACVPELLGRCRRVAVVLVFRGCGTSQGLLVVVRATVDQNPKAKRRGKSSLVDEGGLQEIEGGFADGEGAN